MGRFGTLVGSGGDGKHLADAARPASEGGGGGGGGGGEFGAEIEGGFSFVFFFSFVFLFSFFFVFFLISIEMIIFIIPILVRNRRSSQTDLPRQQPCVLLLGCGSALGDR
jgi:hypothetical protein